MTQKLTASLIAIAAATACVIQAGANQTTAPSTTMPSTPPPSTMPATVLPTTTAMNPTTGPSFDDPRYADWKKFKIGTTVTIAGDVAFGGANQHLEMVTTLTEINADNVVIETKMSVTTGGKTDTVPASRETVSAKTDKVNLTPAGTKDIDAAGKTYKCKVLKLINPADPSDSNVVYINDDVPGGIVQMDLTDPQGKTSTLKMTGMDVK